MSRPESLPGEMSPLLGILDLVAINCPLSVLTGRTMHHIYHWNQITSDPWVPEAVTGYHLELVATPSQSHQPTCITVILKDQEHLIEEEVVKLQQKGAIIPVPATSKTEGFYLTLFLVPKKGWAIETSGQSAAFEQVSAFQNGRSACIAGSPPEGGLDVQSRLRSPYTCTSVLALPLGHKRIPIHMPSLRPLHSPVGVPAASGGMALPQRSQVCDIIG